jgi:hypothetical protein
MKRFFLLTSLSALLFTTVTASAQDDKAKRPSPPAKATQTLASGAVITIDYSSPALKGRTIGKDVEPKKGEVWRAGANEATVFATSKNITVEGKALPAGKYGFYVLSGDKDWTIIFNKKTDLWGADGYEQSNDALRVKVAPGKSATPQERLTYTISKAGKVSLVWGTLDLSFTVK